MPATLSYGFIIPIPRPTLKMANQSFLGQGHLDPSMTFITLISSPSPSDVGRILRTFKIKKNVEVTDNGKIII